MAFPLLAPFAPAIVEGLTYLAGILGGAYVAQHQEELASALSSLPEMSQNALNNIATQIQSGIRNISNSGRQPGMELAQYLEATNPKVNRTDAIPSSNVDMLRVASIADQANQQSYAAPRTETEAVVNNPTQASKFTDFLGGLKDRAKAVAAAAKGKTPTTATSSTGATTTATTAANDTTTTANDSTATATTSQTPPPQEPQNDGKKKNKKDKSPSKVGNFAKEHPIITTIAGGATAAAVARKLGQDWIADLPIISHSEKISEGAGHVLNGIGTAMDTGNLLLEEANENLKQANVERAKQIAKEAEERPVVEQKTDSLDISALGKPVEVTDTTPRKKPVLKTLSNVKVR